PLHDALPIYTAGQAARDVTGCMTQLLKQPGLQAAGSSNSEILKMSCARAFSLLMESEAGLYNLDLTRFLHANRSSTWLENAPMLHGSCVNASLMLFANKGARSLS